ncbi:MAG: ribonuclease H family protein [Acidimicrobiales bacterium]
MEVFTDGACSGNPGPGGWAWVTPDGRHGSGGAEQTTNQRMELQAVLEAVKAFDGQVDIHSDSTYVVKCFNDRWYEGWLKRGWKNSQKKPVANRDLWEPLIDLYIERSDEITFTWVKGHSGHPLNERADELAVAEVTKIRDGEAGSGASGVLAGAASGVSDVEVPWAPDRAVWVVGATSISRSQRRELDRAVAQLDGERDVLVSGLRRGAELEAAEMAASHGVPVAVVLPFPDPAANWPAADRDRFDRALDAAEWVVVLGGDARRPGDAVVARNAWIASAVAGVVVVDDEVLAERIEGDADDVASLEAAPSVLRIA